VEKDAGGLIPVHNGDDGRLDLAEEPLDSLTVRLVSKLPGELEDTESANDGDAEAAATTIDLAVPILGGSLADRYTSYSSVGSRRCVGRDKLLLLLLVSTVGVFWVKYWVVWVSAPGGLSQPTIHNNCAGSCQ
jgi:hypothetical protein